MQIDDGRRVLQVLTAAFPTYPVADDTAELYLAAMIQSMPDATIAFAVALDWSTSQLLFPKVAELIEAYAEEVTRRARRHAAIERAQEHFVTGTVACRACNDHRMVQIGPDEAGYTYAHPCPDCDEQRYRYWLDGHLAIEHDVLGCEHPMCERRAKSRGRKRA